jgi:serine protein kinase
MDSLTTKTATAQTDFLNEFLGEGNKDEFQILNEEMSYAEYIQRVQENPRWERSAHQRVYDMIMDAGSKTFVKYRKTLTHYNFFDNGEEAIFGLDETLHELVQHFRGAAGHFGTEKRILLLHGPVGSSKSTICRALKRGMEDYSRTDGGAWYTYKWVDLPTGPDGVYNKETELAAMFESPLHFLPPDRRKHLYARLNEVMLEQVPAADRTSQYTLVPEGELNPRSKFFLNFLLAKYDGDLAKVLNNHVRVVRMVYSEADRVGIGTFQPKDEKNQDATELTGDVDFAQLNYFGSDSDPRAFSYNGEFNISNRGVFECIEMLKLDKEFLYDFLGASQEHAIKPKKAPQVTIDEVIIGHTNNPEYEKLINDPTMEAFRDRTVKIDVPYQLQLSNEIRIYQRDYGKGRVRQHVAPHTLETAALFAVMTRLQDDKDGKLDLADKVKLYDGKALPGYTEDMVKEFRDKSVGEGMKWGLSPRFIQDQISATLSERHDYINPFMVLAKLKDKLHTSSLITNKEDVAKYEVCIDKAIKELNNILKTEVQKALVSDENAIIRLCSKYIDNLMAYIEERKVINPFTKADQEPDERLMREIEEKLDIPEQGANDFRRQIAIFIAGLSQKGQTFAWDSNPQLKRALEAKLFEDTKDTIKLSALSQNSHAADPDQQKKIDAIKDRLVKQYGYNEQSATDVLNYVSSIFARGDVSED